jgi:hypothetical protein
LRALTRYRTTLLAERARVVNRLQKVLEDTNLKLSAVATNIVGLSARAMLTALLEGETDPQALARLARGKLRAQRAHLEAALVGQIQEQHRFVLTSQLAHIAFLEEQIAQCDAAIEQFLAQAASPPAAPEGDDGGDHLPPSVPSVPSATPVAAAPPHRQLATRQRHHPLCRCPISRRSTSSIPCLA